MSPTFRDTPRRIRWPAWTWSNPVYGLFHGPRFARAFAAWVLTRYAAAWIDAEEEEPPA